MKTIQILSCYIFYFCALNYRIIFTFCFTAKRSMDVEVDIKRDLSRSAKKQELSGSDCRDNCVYV